MADVGSRSSSVIGAAVAGFGGSLHRWSHGSGAAVSSAVATAVPVEVAVSRSIPNLSPMQRHYEAASVDDAEVCATFVEDFAVSLVLG